MGSSRRLILPGYDTAEPLTPSEHAIYSTFSVIPTYSALFGNEPTLEQLLDVVTKYAPFEWLSFTSRLQNMLSGHNAVERERIQQAMCGTCDDDTHARLVRFADERPGDSKLGLYYERQLSTLQQLAILHGTSESEEKLDDVNNRGDLPRALFMTYDLMCLGRTDRDKDSALLACAIQDAIRVDLTPLLQYAVRAFKLYQMGTTQPSARVTKYCKLFELATGVTATEYLLGGLATLVREIIQDGRKLAKGWRPVDLSGNSPSRLEGECLAAFEKVRHKDLNELRTIVRQFEGERSIVDWNLIGLSCGPICAFPGHGAFVVNHTALGARSGFITC